MLALIRSGGDRGILILMLRTVLRRAGLFAAVAVTLASATAAACPPDARPKRYYLALGDSIPYGFQTAKATAGLPPADIPGCGRSIGIPRSSTSPAPASRRRATAARAAGGRVGTLCTMTTKVPNATLPWPSCAGTAARSARSRSD